MNRKGLFVFALMTSLILSASACAEEPASIQLPAPQTDNGMPLMQALKNRESRREFSPEELPLQTVSNLLWAAFGVNRPDSGKRTAPTASDSREMDVYIAKADGLYLYDAEKNLLNLVVKKDIRALTGKQDFVREAPVNLVFVADLEKMGKYGPDLGMFYATADSGFISQNVYLFCASEGLATVVRGWIDDGPLAKAMNLRKNQKIILAQTVGYPKK